MLTMNISKFFLGLEFLSNKVGVIHGDISMNNIMINRVWHHGPDDSPSQLRAIACAAASNISQASTSPTAINQASATSTAINRTPAVSATAASAAQVPITLPPLTQAPAAPIIAQAPAASAIAQAPAASAVGQAPATSAVAAATISQTLTTTSAIAGGLVTSESVPAAPPFASASEDGSVADVAGTTEHIESAGMLIDCDFMRYCNQDTHLTSVRNQVFISLNMLNKTYIGNIALHGD